MPSISTLAAASVDSGPSSGLDDLSPFAVRGYRVVVFDRSPDDAPVDLQLRGPVAGAGFVF